MGCRPENRTERFRLSSSSSSIHALISVSSILLLFIFPIVLATTRDDAIIVKGIDHHHQHQQRQQRQQQQQSLRRPNQQKSVVRYYKLYNRCSELHVSVKGSMVQARATLESHYAWLRFESVALGSLLRIQSNTSHGFLCFTAKGTLTVKHSIGKRRKRCVFQEIHATNDFSQFKSMANRRWFIGFNKNGSRLAGNQWTKAKDPKDRMKCFQFMKTNGAGHQTPTPFHLHGVTDGGLSAPRENDGGPPPGRPRRRTATTRRGLRDGRRARREWSD